MSPTVPNLENTTRQLCDLLESIDTRSLQPEIEDNPANYARIIAVLLALAEWRLKVERHEAEMRRIESEKAAVADQKTPPGLAPETIENIERALKLF